MPSAPPKLWGVNPIVYEGTPSVAYSQQSTKAQLYGTHFLDLSGFLSGGRIAYLAPQQKLGLLSKQRARTGRPDSSRLGPDGTHLTHAAARKTAPFNCGDHEKLNWGIRDTAGLCAGRNWVCHCPKNSPNHGLASRPRAE